MLSLTYRNCRRQRHRPTRWYAIRWSMPKCWKVMWEVQVYTLAVRLSAVTISPTGFLSARRMTRKPVRRCSLPSTKVRSLKIRGWLKWTSWDWRLFQSLRKLLRMYVYIGDWHWISTRFPSMIPLPINYTVTDGLSVHSNLNLPVCRNICVSCNPVRLRIWLPWMPSIVRVLWTISRISSTVSGDASLSSMIFLLWRNTWRIHTVLLSIRSRSCFCPVCWRTSPVANPMLCVRRWVKSCGINWITWSRNSLRADRKTGTMRRCSKRFGLTGKSSRLMLSINLMPPAIHGWLIRRLSWKRIIRRNIWLPSWAEVYPI